MKACCSGCSSPSAARPSMVVTAQPSFITASVEAGIDAPPVDQHRAGAALAVVAALLRAGQVEMVAQGIEQGGPWRELELPLDAVHRQADRQPGGRYRVGFLPCSRSSGHEHLPSTGRADVQRSDGWNRSRRHRGSGVPRDTARHGFGNANAVDAGRKNAARIAGALAGRIQAARVEALQLTRRAGCGSATRCASRRRSSPHRRARSP